MSRHAVPATLWRVTHSRSNGINTDSKFAPGSARIFNLTSAQLANRRKGTFTTQDLRISLSQKKDFPACPFVFASVSILYAVQYAAWLEDRGKAEIMITCIDTRTAKDNHGRRVVWQNVNTLVNESPDLRKPGYDKYADEWVATATVNLGVGSHRVSYAEIKQMGLFKLYPALEVMSRPGNVSWSPAIRRLRAYGFSRVFQLTEAEIDLAAWIAGAFKPVGERKEDSLVPVSIFAALLSVQRRDLEDSVLRGWLARCSDVRSAQACGPEAEVVPTSGLETEMVDLTKDEVVDLTGDGSEEEGTDDHDGQIAETSVVGDGSEDTVKIAVITADGVIDLTVDDSEDETDYGEDVDMEDIFDVMEAVALGEDCGEGRDHVASDEVGAAIPGRYPVGAQPELLQAEELMRTMNNVSVKRRDLRDTFNFSKATLDHRAEDFCAWYTLGREQRRANARLRREQRQERRQVAQPRGRARRVKIGGGKDMVRIPREEYRELRAARRALARMSRTG